MMRNLQGLNVRLKATILSALRRFPAGRLSYRSRRGLIPRVNATGTRHEQNRLLQAIAADFAQTYDWTGRKEAAEHVIRALSAVPREQFVPDNEVRYAYDNRALSIGMGQTISQPFIVALMTELLDLSPADTVLEIGTGSGYQTAILAELVSHVYSIETIPTLAVDAGRRLIDLGYKNVTIRAGNGWLGWPEAAPFEGIIVTAAPAKIPPELVQQLATDGRLVIPVGPRNAAQMLYRCVKTRDGTLQQKACLPVAFVPMIAETESQ